MTRPPRGDLLLAIALAAAVLVEQAVSIGWQWDAELVKVPGCLALAWRRRVPVAACLAAVAFLGAGEWLAEGDSDALAVFAAILVGLFSLAAYAAPRRLWPGIAAATALLCAVATKASIYAEGDAPFLEALAGGVLFAVVILCVPAFVVGLAARRHGELRRTLSERAAQLEAERELHAASAAGAERERMAADLHSVVAAGVRTMLDELGAARGDVRADPQAAEAALARVEDRGRDALAELRALLGVLRRGDEDLALAPQPSLARLDALARHTEAAGLPVALRTEGAARPVTPGLDVAAYRVVEDALRAAALATHAEVVVRWAPPDVELEVAVDGGQLADPGALAAARERVDLFGGRLDAGRRPRGGSALRATLPLEAAR